MAALGSSSPGAPKVNSRQGPVVPALRSDVLNDVDFVVVCHFVDDIQVDQNRTKAEEVMAFLMEVVAMANGRWWQRSGPEKRGPSTLSTSALKA